MYQHRSSIGSASDQQETKVRDMSPNKYFIQRKMDEIEKITRSSNRLSKSINVTN